MKSVASLLESDATLLKRGGAFWGKSEAEMAFAPAGKKTSHAEMPDSGA